MCDPGLSMRIAASPATRGMIIGMHTFLIILLVVAMAATLGVLLFGMVGMASNSNDPARSNRLMRWRVILQAGALVIAMLLISMLKS